jgi:hypothetical protein
MTAPVKKQKCAICKQDFPEAEMQRTGGGRYWMCSDREPCRDRAGLGWLNAAEGSKR